MSSPASLRALLDLLAAASTSNSWVFIDACHGLSWNTITLRKLADEAVPPLAKAGRNVLAWKRGTAGERAVEAKALNDIAEILEKLATPAAQSARAELNDVLQRQRAKELSGLVKTALESGAFEEAESAIAEIAGLARLTRSPRSPRSATSRCAISTINSRPTTRMSKPATRRNGSASRARHPSSARR